LKQKILNCHDESNLHAATADDDAKEDETIEKKKKDIPSLSLVSPGRWHHQQQSPHCHGT